MSAISAAAYPQLMSAVTDSEKIVYLCGAGASMSVGAHELSWTKWLLAGKEYPMAAEQSKLEQRIGNWTTEELIDAATYLLAGLKATGKYQDFMDRTIASVHPVNKIFVEALQMIWRAGDLITTTNYDMLIEESVGNSGISYTTPADILSVIRGKSPNRVIHLHGRYDKENGIDDIIADGPQYQSILDNNGAQFIQNLLSTYPIVIVGCGGTVEDPNLAGFLSFAVEKLGASDIPYFYLMKKGDTVPQLPGNAVIIYYGEDYEDLPEFLKELSVLRLQRGAGIPALISVNPYQESRKATSAFGRMHFTNGFLKFIGRETEQTALDHFLEEDKKFSWWTILGEGGMGKSRLALEWLRKMPSHWFGYFAKKKADAVWQFRPFTDTVVIFDYVLGQEQACADTIAAYLTAFENTPFKLRILLLERRKRTTEDDWLIRLKREMVPDARLEFEAGSYREQALCLTALGEQEELIYTENYLESYLPLLEKTEFIEHCSDHRQNTAEEIQKSYHGSMAADCDRPLYLSVYIEVWISKEGHIQLNSTEELLSEYLNKEKKRWGVLLGQEELVDSYLRVLAVACAIGEFNLTDRYGDDYLSEDCRKLTQYFDEKSARPGAENLFLDLYTRMDELVETEEGDSIVEMLNDPDKLEENGNEEAAEVIRSLDADERFAYMAAYAKLDANPEEMYLWMLVNAGAATPEQKRRVQELHEAECKRIAALPPYAWIVEPIFPDIIKEYIVSYAINERDIERFARLARANSKMGLAHFIALALEDWPDNRKLQKLAITPPAEVLNYFEYYMGLLPNLRAVKDLRAVEDALLQSEPIFYKYALEVWRRIAIALTERGDMERLFESSSRFVTYLQETTEKISFRKEAIDILEAYGVGLHNAEQVEKYSLFLDKCTELAKELQEVPEIGEFCCDNYARLQHLKLYKDRKADLQPEWEKIGELLAQWEYPEKMCRLSMETTREAIQYLTRKGDISGLQRLEDLTHTICQKQNICEAAEAESLCMANIAVKREKVEAQTYETIQQHLKTFPQSKLIRMAYVSVSQAYYMQTADYRKTPDTVIRHAKELMELYPENIEFREGYFGLLVSSLRYAQSRDLRNEQKRLFREMKRIAETADDSEYEEATDMRETVALLQRIYGY